MERLQAVLDHPDFRSCLALTAVHEEKRRFCRHDLAHAYDVARIFYIFWLQQNCSAGTDRQDDPCAESCREMIYAAALVHDIGRWRQYLDKTKDHAEESAQLAVPILQAAGFDGAEITRILSAVRDHRTPTAAGLGGLLYRADKVSRRCDDCQVKAECRKPQSIGGLLDWRY